VNITVVDSAAELAEKGAELFRRAAGEAAAARQRFAVAISGGSTPRAMHRLLSTQPYRSTIPWSKVHLFWVDERLVPADDPASNYGAARQDLLDRVPLPSGHIHPMTLSDNPSSAASAYQRQLQNFFGRKEGGFPLFDLIILGIGADGHTASIFPTDRSALETSSWVVAVKGGKPNVDRLTLSAPVLNRARCVAFLVAGRNKAEVVKKVLEDENAGLPATRIHPIEGRLLWLLDREAAALLPRKSRLL
jgi:6-phosphogluconolactonase